MSLRRQAIKLAASLPKGEERTALLNAITATDKEAGCEKLPEGPMRDNCEKKSEEGGKDKDEGKDEKKDKKASRSILASFKGNDTKLAREVVRLAGRLPEHRSVLLETLKQAAGEEEATVNTPGFDATEIGEVEKGGPHEGDADESYMKDEFTQQEFHELGDQQEAGSLPSEDPKKYAADKTLRRGLIRLASTLPKGSREKRDLLFFLASDEEESDDEDSKKN